MMTDSKKWTAKEIAAEFLPEIEKSIDSIGLDVAIDGKATMRKDDKVIAMKIIRREIESLVEMIRRESK